MKTTSRTDQAVTKVGAVTVKYGIEIVEDKVKRINGAIYKNEQSIGFVSFAENGEVGFHLGDDHGLTKKELIALSAAVMKACTEKIY